MKLEIERQDFLRAWQNAEKLASAKSASESAKGVLITASDDNTVILEATDLSTSIRCRAKGANVLDSGKAVIPAGIFGGMLRKLDTEDFVLEVNSERGLLNAGRNKMRFSVISAEEFPNIPESSNAENICDISAPLLAKIIAEGSSAASQPQDFPKYLGTCLIRTSEGVIMAVSTDGKRLSLSKSTCSASKEDDLLLPAQALKDFAKATASLDEDKTVSLRADDSTVWFGLEDYEYSIRRVDSAFPKFERILNTECHTTLHITPAHIMAMALNPNGELRITARAPELGTARETLQATIEGGELQVGFNVSFFIDGLKALGGEQAVIEFSSDEGQTRMKREGSDDFLYMLMPARLSMQDIITEEEMGDFTSVSDDPMPMPEPEPELELEQEQEAAPESQDNQEVSSTDTQF